MSSIGEDVQLAAGTGTRTLDGWTQFANSLFDKDKLAYHTEIQNPDAMTYLDHLAVYYGDAICVELGAAIAEDNRQYRENMVPYQRKRAGETERISKGKVEEEKESKKLKDIMTGMTR